MDNPLPTTPPAPESSGLPTGAPPALAVAAGRGASWWSEGWRFYRLTGDLADHDPARRDHDPLSVIPVIGQVASMLLHPALSAGLVGCRAQDRGGRADGRPLFAGFGEAGTPRRSRAALFRRLVAIALSPSRCCSAIGAGSIRRSSGDACTPPMRCSPRASARSSWCWSPFSWRFRC
jgi:hypothetical protein